MDKAHDLEPGTLIQYGTGKDISVLDLVDAFAAEKEMVPHPHPQAEIQIMRGNYSKARKLLGISPKTSLQQGIDNTKAFFKDNE